MKKMKLSTFGNFIDTSITNIPNKRVLNDDIKTGTREDWYDISLKKLVSIPGAY